MALSFVGENIEMTRILGWQTLGLLLGREQKAEQWVLILSQIYYKVSGSLLFSGFWLSGGHVSTSSQRNMNIHH